MKKIKHGLYQLFIAADQFLNVLLWPFSFETWADETFSARCGRLGHRYPYKVYKAVVDFLFLWQGPDHCVNAFEKEKTRYQAPPAARNLPTDPQ